VITFGQPAAFALLAVVAAMAVAALLLARWRQRSQRLFAGPRPAMWSRGISWHTTFLVLAAATLTVVAAARPQWGNFEVSRERSGVDLVIALDISQSMVAEDAQPSRLGLAQSEAVRLIEAQRGSRIGLVFFAGTAIVRSPLTTDTQALTELVRRAEREFGLTRAGSDMGAALDQASLILEAGEAEGKAIILVSDGEDHAGAFPSRLAPLRERGIVVYTAGVGSEAGSTINERDPRSGLPRLKLDGSGEPVVTRLDESSLQSIVAGGPGRYLRLDGQTSLTSLNDDLARLSQTPLGADLQRVPIERFQWFASAALALLVLAWLLPERLAFGVPRFAGRLRPSPGLTLVLLALVIGGCGGNSLRDDNADANRLFAAGDYEDALAAYQELLSQRPDVPELSYNVGNTLNRLEEYERAVAETQRALPPDDAKLGAATFYALGNHLYALDELEQAYTAYRNALVLDPHDGDAKYNLELTLLRLMERPPPEEQAGSGPEAEPTPGEQGDPGEQPQGTPTPSGQPAPGSTPQPTSADLQRSLQEALRGMDEQLTFEQAIEILDLLRQQQERQLPPGPAGAPGGPDY
jgi:Ca-activated chloride channel family protein